MKLILPLTVISFTVITKWWYVLPIDAPDSMMIGFPFPYLCDGWHTSMSLQIFILEMFIDLLIYFLFWFALIFCIRNYFTKNKIYKAMTFSLTAIAGICVFCAIYIASFSENKFYLKRNFELEVFQTGFKFIWDGYTRPVDFDFENRTTKNEK